MTDKAQIDFQMPPVSFETLFNEVPCFISLQDRNLNIVSANRRFRESFGDPIGRPCFEVYKNRECKCEVCPVEQSFADGRSHQSEEIVEDLNGRRVHVIIHTTPIRDDNGQIMAVMEMSTDISEVKRLQIERDASRKLYQSLFDNVPCFVTVLDRDLKMIEANRLFRETFGEIENEHCYELVQGRTSKCEGCYVEKTFADGCSQRNESVVRCRDGRELNVISFTEPVRDENGEIISVMELAADVTEQKDLERKLNKINRRLLTLFEEVPCYITVVDKDLRIVRANRSFRDDFGNGVGGRCFEVYKHRAEPCVECPVKDTFRDGKVHQSEELVRSGNGERINVLCYTAPIRRENGEITHVMEMSTNITEIRELQSQLTSIGLLVGSISHSLKGLLSNLGGGVYLLDSGFKKDDMTRVKKGWEMVKRNVDRIRSMVLDVLYYAKERQPDFTPVVPLELAFDVAQIFEKKSQETGIEFQRRFEEGLESFDGDMSAMRSLLVNILENSFEACRSDSKKEHHSVVFCMRRAPDHVVFEITDNGIGMDRETRDKVFTLFFSSKGAAGTGLGLFVSNKIAEQHGGKVLVDSVPGKGTTFRVSIPWKQSPKT